MIGYRTIPVFVLVLMLAVRIQAFAQPSQQAGKAQSTYYVH
jgi:hypothetical protein